VAALTARSKGRCQDEKSIVQDGCRRRWRTTIPNRVLVLPGGPRDRDGTAAHHPCSRRVAIHGLGSGSIGVFGKQCAAVEVVVRGGRCVRVMAAAPSPTVHDAARTQLAADPGDCPCESSARTSESFGILLHLDRYRMLVQAGKRSPR